MKLILVTIILIYYVTIGGITPFDTDTVAESAGYYYFWYGGEAGVVFRNQHFRKRPRPEISIYQYRPSREGYNIIRQAGYEGVDDYLYISLAASKRYSPLYYGGGTAETGYSFRKERFYLKGDASFLYKKTGNIDYSVNNKLSLAYGNRLSARNVITLISGINTNRENRFTAYINTRPDIGLSWRRVFGNYQTKLSLETDRIITSRRGFNLNIELGKSLDNRKIATVTTTGRHFSQSFSYRVKYGDYTPPLTYAPTIFPVTGESHFGYSLSLMKMIDNVPEADIVITVRRGDNLNLISRRLPAEADDSYRRNINAIALYNNIRPPYVIHPGQQIRVPPKVLPGKHRDLPALSERDTERVKEAISLLRTSDYMEIRLNAALWAYIIGGQSEKNAILPVRADVGNKFLLNTQSLAEMELRKPKSAIRKLTFALAIDPHCPVLTTNLAVAYYLDNKPQLARQYLIEAKELAETHSLDTSFHEMFLKEMLR